jgi:hypothetical protein
VLFHVREERKTRIAQRSKRKIYATTGKTLCSRKLFSFPSKNLKFYSIFNILFSVIAFDTSEKKANYLHWNGNNFTTFKLNLKGFHLPLISSIWIELSEKDLEVNWKDSPFSLSNP